MNNCFSIYHTNWIPGGPKSNFIWDKIPTKVILFFLGCLEVNSTWLITPELANQHARKVLFTCVVYAKLIYCSPSYSACVVYTWSLIHTYVGESGSILMASQAMFPLNEQNVIQEHQNQLYLVKKIFSKGLLSLSDIRNEIISCTFC